jgi:hypothetical protein
MLDLRQRKARFPSMPLQNVTHYEHHHMIDSQLGWLTVKFQHLFQFVSINTLTHDKRRRKLFNRPPQWERRGEGASNNPHEIILIEFFLSIIFTIHLTSAISHNFSTLSLSTLFLSISITLTVYM